MSEMGKSSSETKRFQVAFHAEKRHEGCDLNCSRIFCVINFRMDRRSRWSSIVFSTMLRVRLRLDLFVEQISGYTTRNPDFERSYQMEN
jgi:hypothetical protein